MNGDIKKPVRCANTKQASNQKMQCNFNRFEKLKAEFTRLAVWFLIVKGG